MKCKKVQKQLPEYLEGTLTENTSTLVYEHLQNCNACRRELRTFEKTIQLAGNIQVEYPPTELWENFVPILHARMAQKEAEERRMSIGWFSTLKLASYGVAALILMGFLALGISIMISYNRSEASPLPIEAIIAELMDDNLAKQVEAAHFAVTTEVPIAYEISDAHIVEEDDMPIAEDKKQINLKQVVNVFATELVYPNGVVDVDLQFLYDSTIASLEGKCDEE